MLNRIFYRLLVVSSLFFFAVTNPVLAAGEVEDTQATMQEVAAEKIDINKATIEQLAMIKGIGEKKALAIIEYREMNGAFANIAELVKVKGIGESTLKKIQPFVTI
jgi:competence protein ComEA